MKLRIPIALSLCILIVVFAAPARIFAVKERWTKVVSPNFVLLGNSGENEARKVAAMLEQFRYTASQILPKTKIESPAPVKVFLFRNNGTFNPFKPRYRGKVRDDVRGYFFGDGDHNYIALTTESGRARGYEVIFHEYQHFILGANLPDAPLWLDEGLAEYFSAFEPRYEGREVLLGRAVGRHVAALRSSPLMPLRKLFDINPRSPEYNESSRAGLFYAQSWALVHYLMLGDDGKRQGQFARFIGMLEAGEPVEEVFRRAFQADYRTIEKELRDYISSHMFPATVYSFPDRIDFAKETQSAMVSEAEAEFHLGDLLLNARRYSEAEPRLRKAIERDASCAECRIALGELRLRQHRYDEAKKHLQTGLSIDSRNYRGHHFYANVLFEEGDYEGAIRSYDQALRINPNLSNVHLDMSFAYVAAGRQRQAGEAFDRALKLSSLGDSFFRARSYAMLRIGRGAQAAGDSLTFIKRRGWRDNAAPYAAFAAYLGYRMNNLSAEADKLLAEAAAKIDAREWPHPVVKYLKREITAQQLISSAKDNDELTEARAYLGMDLSLNGKHDEAIPHLQWVKAKGNPGYVEYGMACGELNRIGKMNAGRAQRD